MFFMFCSEDCELKKIKFFERDIVKKFTQILAITLSIFSTVMIFISLPSAVVKLIVGLSVLTLHIGIYIGVWIYWNKKKEVTIKIRNTNIIIKEGDIFEEKGLKIIPFNEYFDTNVDDIVIAKSSLNGLFVNKVIEDIDALDKYVFDFLQDTHFEKTAPRKNAKNVKYELGTVVKYEEYLLLAYSKFDSENKAYINKEDIAPLYMKMWSEIDKYKAGNCVNIPVLGSSRIVRNAISAYSYQQLLELILWSFRVSDVDLCRESTLNIIVHSSLVKEINFLKLLHYSD